MAITAFKFWEIARYVRQSQSTNIVRTKAFLRKKEPSCKIQNNLKDLNISIRKVPTEQVVQNIVILTKISEMKNNMNVSRKC